MILPFTVVLAANEVREVALSGQYLELRTAAAAVAVIELNDRSGGVISRMESAEATDYVRTQKTFETVRINNGATAQTVRFYYGDGDSGSNRFTGVVSGEVSLAAATLAALEYVQVRAELSTGSYAQTAALAANTAHQVFAPGANVGGALILSASMSKWFDNGADGVLIAKASAPATVTDGEVIMSIGHAVIRESTGLQAGSATLPGPQLLAAGLGLYFITGQLSSVAFQRFCRYKLL